MDSIGENVYFIFLRNDSVNNENRRRNGCAKF